MSPQPKRWDVGWFPDPERPGEERFWNGSEWTRSRETPREHGGPETAPPGRPVPWALLATGALVAILIVVVGVVLVSEGDSPIQEDDQTEFAEVSITDCEPPGPSSPQAVRGLAENGSSQRSDYRIEVSVVTADGTRIGTGGTTVNDVESGQSAVWSVETDTAERDWSDGATCRVVAVERTASL